MQQNRRFDVPARVLLCAVFSLGSAAHGQPIGAGNTFNVKDRGATGKRGDNATKAIQAAIDACTAAGGGIVYVSPGEYTTGAINLKDNVNLYLEGGATLFLSQDPADFAGRQRSMINSAGAKNIAVTGRGAIDGLAQYEYVDMRGRDPEIEVERQIAAAVGIPMKRYYRTGMQTYMFILNDSTDVRLEGITVINSPLWNVRLNGCDRVFIRGVRIYSDLDKGVNSDGIDIVSSSNVLISDSIVVTADDAIAVKTQGRGGQPAKPAENITVTNCILTSSSTPMNIGTETEADIRHVVFSNSVIRDSNRAFGINVQDGATVSDIRFTNITMASRRRHWNWWGSAETFKFILKKRNANSRLGTIRDIVIDNVISHARGTSSLTGHPDRPLENIAISNLRMYMEPEDVPDKRATDAIQVSGVKDLKLRNVSVTWDEAKPEEKWGSALRLKDVTALEVDGFTGRQGLKAGTAAVIVLENVVDGVLRNLRAAEGSVTFLELRGPGNKQLWSYNNELSKAKKSEVFTEGAQRESIRIQ